nr:ribonuclease H [Tanacetum cinerariifolium]
VFCSGCKIRGYKDFSRVCRHKNMVVFQMDMNTAFLNGNLQEEVYVSHPDDTPLVEKSKLDEDKEGEAIDSSHYHGMISTFLYLTASRPDLQFAICMCTRSKHIDIRYHFIKEHVKNGAIEIYFVNAEYQLADIFTKALGREIIEFLINKLGMRSFTPETLQQLTDEVDEWWWNLFKYPVSNINPIATQQVALDNALVAPKKRLKIEKCNARIEFSASLESHQDLIGSGHQKLKSYRKYGALIPKQMINQDIKDSKAYKNYLDFATGKATPKKTRKFKKVASPSKKLSLILEEEPAKKPKWAKKPAKKSTTMPTTGVVIKDTPGVFVSKKQAPTKVDRGKGMDLLSEATLLEDAQLKKALKKSKLETHKLHASGSGYGVGSQTKVPDEQQNKTNGIDERTDDDSNDDDSDDVTNFDDDVDSDADGDNEASDSEKTHYDDDENPNLNQNEDEEEEYEEEYVRTLDSYEFSDDNDEYEELYKVISKSNKVRNNNDIAELYLYGSLGDCV